LHPLSETESTQYKKFYTDTILNHPQEPREREVERGERREDERIKFFDIMSKK
jgi:hypothetical protein